MADSVTEAVSRDLFSAAVDEIEAEIARLREQIAALEIGVWALKAKQKMMVIQTAIDAQRDGGNDGV